MTFEEFKKELDAAQTEEAVKSVYAKYFNLSYDTTHGHDLYTPQVLFEFKQKKNFQNLKLLPQFWLKRFITFDGLNMRK